ncbi:uncharacterized protein PAC_00302 [Phialocephala subalpina]|uniref:F-box domain-containing protein n=1 Tax=Phialocephala subalpina TaxID=576137 RepID=A0A1L7WCA8_9HELO|nr:uncharacterized protein PAC_00302 [Phialocephala subalpina]
MGYSENCCQICAVSINVARVRTKHEPESAGWGYSSPEYYSGDPMSSRCTTFKEQSGCENIAHEQAEWIHIAGRGCTFDGGYNGLKIGVEEMKGMNRPRYIVKRPEDQEPDEESTDYEKESDFFLTSQTTCPPDDFEPGDLEHVRYGIDNFFPQNYCVVDMDDDMGVGVPVHDACWMIFERVCKMRLGKVDLQGFMALWARQACGNCGFQNMKQEQIIFECRQQFWKHVAGTEYLGANPVEIPGLLFGLSEHYGDYPRGDGVFMTRTPSPDNPTVPQNPTDPFSRLPAELKNMILYDLPSKDITSLRLASRSFRQLPKQLFHKLIQDELPWFWELDELKQMDDDWWREWFKDDDPEKVNNEQDAESIRRSGRGNFTKNVNWLSVYKQLCILRMGVVGVRNRARVWYLAEEIVKRVDELRRSLKERSAEPAGHDLGEDEDIPVQPTEEEDQAGLVKNGLYCPRCKICQIERQDSK